MTVAFEGMTLTRSEGTTALTGTVRGCWLRTGALELRDAKVQRDALIPRSGLVESCKRDEQGDVERQTGVVDAASIGRGSVRR